MTAEIEKKMVGQDAAAAHNHIHGENCNHENDEDHSSDEELEEGEGELTLNRNEKKARKIFSKVGMKPVAGIERVTIVRGHIVFAIANPTVYMTAQGQYVVFGEAKVEDSRYQAQAMAAQRLANAQRPAEDASTDEKGGVEIEGEEEVDTSGVDEKDIKLVMEQANVSKARAIQALKNNDCDLVNAIMELTG